MSEPRALVEIDAMSVDYISKRHKHRAVQAVSLNIGFAETVGLVGESGSGKSTIGRALLGLVPVAEGAIRFDGEDITHPTARRRRELTQQIQVIYQDPYGSLNPARTIGATLAEPLTAHPHQATGSDTRRQVAEVLDLVGMPSTTAARYPGDFSGGQRQRIAIARALILRPRFIVCDEAVSALDLSIQAQVLNLLEDLRAELRISYLFISHDLAVVRHIASRIAVLYRGALVELGSAEQVSRSPQHAYTAMLQAAAPVPDPAKQRRRREAFLQRSAYLDTAADAGHGEGVAAAHA